jgi:hypothetical protein
MPGELERYLFTLVVVLFLGWFALGTQLNVRRGNKVLRWLQDGLTLLGEKTTLRWLGSSAVELKVQDATGPLRWVQIFVVLEPRDIPFLWWFFRARGRRDLLILRGQLHTMPPFEFEAWDSRAWSTRGLEQEAKAKGWAAMEPTPESTLTGYAHGSATAARDLLHDYTSRSALSGLPWVRLAVRQGVPNLEVQWRLAGFETSSSRRVLERWRSIAERLQELSRPG